MRMLVLFKDSLLRAIIFFLMARRLGHGRRMEGYLVLCKFFGAFIFFFFQKSSANSQSTVSLFWYGYSCYLFLPFLLAFMLSGTGLLFNIIGWRYSQALRFVGSVVGFFLWFWFCAKLVSLDDITTSGFILGVPAMLYGEGGVMFAAAANIPRPGAPGNMGTLESDQ
jgi:hypothetical protein